LIGEVENSLFIITGGDTVVGYWGGVVEGNSEVVVLVYSGGVWSVEYMADDDDVYWGSCCGGVGGVEMKLLELWSTHGRAIELSSGLWG